MNTSSVLDMNKEKYRIMTTMNKKLINVEGYAVNVDFVNQTKTYNDNLEKEGLKLRREKRIKFVNDHKEEIEKLREQPYLQEQKYENNPARNPRPAHWHTVSELKDECMIRDLKTTGKKSVLLERLFNGKNPKHRACSLSSTSSDSLFDTSSSDGSST